MSTLYIISAKTNGGYADFDHVFKNHNRKDNYAFSPNGLIDYEKVKIKLVNINNKLDTKIYEFTEKEIIQLARNILISKPSEFPNNWISNEYKELENLVLLKENPYYDFSNYEKELLLIVQKCFDPSTTNIENSADHYSNLINTYGNNYLKEKGNLKISKVRIIAHKDDFPFSREPNKTYTTSDDNNRFPLKYNGELINDIKIHTFSHSTNDSPISFPIVERIIFNKIITKELETEIKSIFSPKIENYYYLFNELKSK